MKPVDKALEELLDKRQTDHEKDTLNEFLYIVCIGIGKLNFTKLMKNQYRIARELEKEYEEDELPYTYVKAMRFIEKHEDIPEIALRHALRL